MQYDHDESLKLVGLTIDNRIHIERVWRHGGCGIIYRAFHTYFGETVAVKVLQLRTDLRPRERDEWRRRFQTEGQLLYRLGPQHPAFVRVLDSGALCLPDGSPRLYIVMEWLEGITLHDDIERRRRGGFLPRSFGETFELLSPIAHALGIAHAQDPCIVHRDLCPRNILLETRQTGITPRLLDFGAAKEAMGRSTSSDDTLTGARILIATPEYAAPEYRRGLRTGPPADVYSLALIFYEVLTGQQAPTDISARERVSTYASLGNWRTAAVLSRALASDPRRRYPSVREFWEALSASREAAVLGPGGPTSMMLVDDELPTQIRIVSDLRRLNDQMTRARQQPTVAPTPPPPKQPTAARWTLAFLFLLVCGLAILEVAHYTSLRARAHELVES